MALISDGLLLAAALTAAIYCHVLAGRLRKLKSLDGGVGQAIATLVSQVEEMRTALKAARAASGDSVRTLAERTARAEMAAGRLELLLAALHDREGSSPVDAAARRAERKRDNGFAQIRNRGVTDGGGVAAMAAPFRLDREYEPQPEESPFALREDAPAPAAEPEEVPAYAPEPEEPAPAEPRRIARRLFRIEFDEAGPDAAQEGVIGRIPAARTAGSRPARKDAAALKAALEALAKETSE